MLALAAVVAKFQRSGPDSEINCHMVFLTRPLACPWPNSPPCLPNIFDTGDALDIAARTASVSYKMPVSATHLREAFNSGTPAPEFHPHVYALLDEASVSLLASVVEQLHREEGVERAQALEANA